MQMEGCDQKDMQMQRYDLRNLQMEVCDQMDMQTGYLVRKISPRLGVGLWAGQPFANFTDF